MIGEDKVLSQALTNVAADGYEALPLAGPGRWMTYPDGTIIYTDDANKLFAKNANGHTGAFIDAIVAINRLFGAGKTATEGFEALRGPVPVVSGDLSEIA
jgi:hypothetical protein